VMVSLLVNFLTGLPHFLINVLEESPIFTSDLPQRKLSAGVMLESSMQIGNNANLFSLVPLVEWIAYCLGWLAV